ncbi:RagB/SusD family nutrient uptake outer membrane protein, partial [Pseudoxanthomonas sp. SGD-10]
QIFRYADVLLMRAEALNEANQGIQAPAEVYERLRDIRRRAGLLAANDFGIPANMTKEDARAFIQQERRLEFFMEEQRYWDVRRWKLAETEFNKDLLGMRITKTGTNTYSYERFTAGTINFEAPKMYMYPIPNIEVLRNPNLVQNIGW